MISRSKLSARGLRGLVRFALVIMLTLTATSAVFAQDGGSYHGQAPAGSTPPRPPAPPTAHRGVSLAPPAPSFTPATKQGHRLASIAGLHDPDPKLAGTKAVDPIALKLLLISADGTETDFFAMQAFLNQIGIPYDTLIATQTYLQPGMLSPDPLTGNYKGIILATGNLAYFNATTQQWQSAFDATEWNTLWSYESQFGIRQVTSYTFPGGVPDYGLTLVSGQDTTSTPLAASLSTAGQGVYSYLNAANPVSIQYAWTYLATPGAGTTALLSTATGYAIASIHTYPDGRQNLAITAANNSNLIHSELLSYGTINWVSKGLFLGERHANLSPQVDDLLIDDDIWNTTAMTDTTGLSYRITGQEYKTFHNQLGSTRSTYPAASNLWFELAFNGQGATGIYSPDTLTPAVQKNTNWYRWVSHTFDHANLDTINYADTQSELTQNDNIAANTLQLGNYNFRALVQPDVSGLYNTTFQQSAADWGIRYLISDTSQPAWNNPSPNAGFYTTSTPPQLVIPRHPSNLFYNVATPAQWVSEYNYYYGPAGIRPYFDHNLSYSEILDFESSQLLQYLLKWDIDPIMWHQPNMAAYDGTHSLLGDLTNAVLKKYSAASNLPIRSMGEVSIGTVMARRMASNTSGVRASFVPCTATSAGSLTLTVTKAAQIPITGVSFGTNKESYGGQNISYVQVNPSAPVTVPVPACP